MLDAAVARVEVERAVSGLDGGSGAAGAHGERAEPEKRQTDRREFAHDDTSWRRHSCARAVLVRVFLRTDSLRWSVKRRRYFDVATASRSTPSSHPARSWPTSIMQRYMTGAPLSGLTRPPLPAARLRLGEVDIAGARAERGANADGEDDATVVVLGVGVRDLDEELPAVRAFARASDASRPTERWPTRWRDRARLRRRRTRRPCRALAAGRRRPSSA